MEKRMYNYVVQSWSRGPITVEAANATQAKRVYCRLLGIKPSDQWCGLSCFTAHRI